MEAFQATGVSPLRLQSQPDRRQVWWRRVVRQRQLQRCLLLRLFLRHRQQVYVVQQSHRLRRHYGRERGKVWCHTDRCWLQVITLRFLSRPFRDSSDEMQTGSDQLLTARKKSKDSPNVWWKQSLTSTTRLKLSVSDMLSKRKSSETLWKPKTSKVNSREESDDESKSIHRSWLRDSGDVKPGLILTKLNSFDFLWYNDRSINNFEQHS